MSAMVAGRRSSLARVVVRPMRRGHLAEVLDIERRVYPGGWRPAVFDAELSRPDTRRYLVALDPGTRRRRRRGLQALLGPRPIVVGYAGLMLLPSSDADAVGSHRGEAHVTTVAVHPEHHRRKVASRLLVALLDAAVDAGANTATLEVRSSNHGAQRLYTHFGFVPVGVRPGYYAETGEDAVVMWASELASAAFAARLDAQRARLDAPGGASGAPDLAVPWVKGRIGLDAPGEPPARGGSR